MIEEIQKLYKLLPEKSKFRKKLAKHVSRSSRTITDLWLSDEWSIPLEFQEAVLNYLKDYMFSEKTKFFIQKREGRWLLNDKPYPELSKEEKQLFEDFIKYHREIHNSCNCK